MASPQAETRTGWLRYQRFSELIFLSALGHAIFAGVYGFGFGQWGIAATFGVDVFTVICMYPLLRSNRPTWQVRFFSHLLLIANFVSLLVSLAWMGLEPSTAVWWIVWWPMFVIHVMGIMDGLPWVPLSVAGGLWIWANQVHHWVAPLMRPEQNPVQWMQMSFLVIGGCVAVVVRRAYDRFESDIDANQRQIAEQNLTLEKRNETLENMLQAVQASSLERTRLFAQISHEVRTPLNGLLGFTQLLGRSELSEAQRMQLEQIDRCGHTLLQIINDVLDFSRLEVRSTTLHKQSFKAVELANEAVDMLSPVAQQKGVKLVREFPGDDIAVLGDPLRVKQVLLNLLANAVKFAPGGEVVVRCRELRQENGSPALYMEVQDSGIGISKDALDHVFQPFNKASDATMLQYGGSGLGLAICKRLVDMMDGRIGVNSEPGKGSLFWFEVPLGA